MQFTERRIKIKDRYLANGLQYFDQRSANEGFLYLLFYLTLFVSDLTPHFFAIDNIDNALNPKLGSEGAFPEFYFFDCHSCHRRIYDDQKFQASTLDNPARPIPVGMPPFNDENMIMLSAAARISAPGLATRFDADSRAFHAAMSASTAS